MAPPINRFRPGPAGSAGIARVSSPPYKTPRMECWLWFLQCAPTMYSGRPISSVPSRRIT